ncbi:UPF0193 protein EVG1 homolog [Cylas formicarius]|uniref:UPF0193 protein EVG1 homolog n=1 Tax=Cylas formicarius TaxID=197179 RepID=UPI002958D5F5|nr:UPF0193 protein EVG1 homolog [Cylas formicarius]
MDDWSSKTVPRGGILHPAKANYSAETEKFLKLLMEESKMSMMQRKRLNYALRNGDPLPSLANITKRKTPNLPEVTIRPASSKRRSMETIIRSGAYERDAYKPNHLVVDREREKDKLANKMAYNKDLAVSKEKVLEKYVEKEMESKPNRFDELLKEIKERQDWLREMQELGEDKKYRPIIEQQIQNKVRELEKLKMD